MSGGNTTSEIGQGLLGAGLIASNVMTGGADLPLDAAVMPAAGADMSGIIASGAAPAYLGALSAGTGADMSAIAASPELSASYLSALGSGAGAGTGSSALSAANAADNYLQALQQANPNGPDYSGIINSGQSAQYLQSLNNAGTDVYGNMGSSMANYSGIVNPTQAAQAAQTTAQNTGTPWYQQYWNNLTQTNNPGGGMNWTQKGTLGAAGIATLLALQKSGAMRPNYLPNYNPTTAASMGLNRQMASNYQPQMASQWGYATGGGVSVAPGSVSSQGVAPSDLTQTSTALPSQLQDLMSQYGVSQQQATQGIQSLMGNTSKSGSSFASGGVPHLKEGSFIVPADVVSHFGNGSTDAGLRALHGHLGATPIMGDGDGMSDDIHTSIDGKQPARVANGEALVSPDRVKELGKGSTDAGAKKLYAMMNRVRKARTGTTKQGKQIKADKYLPV
jgi:hypothetical protein